MPPSATSAASGATFLGGVVLFCSVPRCFGEYQMQWKANKPKRYIYSISTYGVKQDGALVR